jgi:DNA-binding NtrC family response regulator
VVSSRRKKVLEDYLDREVELGEFRADLYYRLETFALEVPPLRQRGDDIDLLCAHFVSRFAEQAAQPLRGISLAAMEALRRYPFPGNVRELSNAIERAVVFCRGEELDVADLPARIRGHQDSPPAGNGEAVALFDPAMPPSLKHIEQRYVHYVLTHTGGNKQQAARLLGIGRRTLYRYLEETDPI